MLLLPVLDQSRMHFLTPNDTADVGEGMAIPFVRLYLGNLLEEVRDGSKVPSSKPLDVRFYRFNPIENAI